MVVTKDHPNRRKRLAIDYSQTINRYTELDAYPIPRVDEFVNKVAQYRVFSSIDLKSAYHQLPLHENDRPLTAFEADGGLWQFTRLPFGVQNGGSCFQRSMNEFIAKEKIPDTFAYLDNIYVCGYNDEDHDNNLGMFQRARQKYNITVNDDKCLWGVRTLPILGSLIEKGTIRPDPARLKPLRELPSPKSPKALQRVLGMFSHYSRWIPKYSDKVAPLLNVSMFPLDSKAEKAFQDLKLDIENSVVTAIDYNVPFEVECDASDVALAGVLNQRGRPVAFYSKTLHESERNWPPVEKEACSIIESVRNWRHFLLGRKFSIKTDQEAVSYIFNSKHKSKIKNEKLYRWRLELAGYTYDIVHKKGVDNVVPDTFTRVYCSLVNGQSLYQLHDSLCHPGVTRMTAFVRSRNLPHSVEEVRKTTADCNVCAECKPRFYKPPESSHLIKATQPFERLNLDFKGPLPSTSKNKYLLDIVDEYSRYPFAIPCPDISAPTVFAALRNLFTVFGNPAYIHSDRGKSFMSNELKGYLTQMGIATSKSTPYHPQGNGLVERYNGTIWKTVTLCLKSRKLHNHQWEIVLPDSLHAIRSLINTSTNCTPHERLFNFKRRTSSGVALPSWLCSPGKVLLRKFVKNSKYDPLVDEVELLEANPTYAHIKYPDGRESTVNISDLAPPGKYPEVLEQRDNTLSSKGSLIENGGDGAIGGSNVQEQSETPPPVTESFRIPETDVRKNVSFSDTITDNHGQTSILRRSARSNLGIPPDRLKY